MRPASYSFPRIRICRVTRVCSSPGPGRGPLIIASAFATFLAAGALGALIIVSLALSGGASLLLGIRVPLYGAGGA